MCAIFLACVWALGFAQSTESRVEKNDFISRGNPTLTAVVDPKLKFVGSVPFSINNSVAGTRFIFLDANERRQVRRMFIVQQEGFLPGSSEIYQYPITKPFVLGGVAYQHSVILFDSDEEVRENPGKETDVTDQFLHSLGYTLEPELVMTRFARPADSEHKHEIIFFCFDALSSYGHKLKDFPDNSQSPEKEDLKQKADAACRSSFTIQ